MAMQEIGMFEAKTHLAEIIRNVQQGKDVCITNRNHPVAYLVSVEHYQQHKKEAVLERMLKLRTRIRFDSIDEILELRDEGKK
jgi:prevent-host-death family protein